MRDAREVVIRPLVTERSTELGEDQNAYTFVVAKEANKIEIRQAIERLFSVKVASVRTMNYRGKWRRVGRSQGRRAAFKKAIVKLAEGERIDVYEGI